MNNIIDETKELKEILNNTNEFKNYFRLKTLVENDLYLESLRSQIAKATNEGNLELKNKLLKEYNEYPLTVNYNESKEEIFEIINQIKNILSE